MSHVFITRGTAAGLIESLRDMLAEGRVSQLEVARALSRAGVPELEPCTGEAHSSAFIDNCPRCAPRWGWTGPFVKIR